MAPGPRPRRALTIYDHISLRSITETTSTETGVPAINYHGASAGYAEDFATITRWNALKAAELCERLAAIEDGPGVSVLDNTVLMLASCMDGVRHWGVDLPCILVGGLGGVLKTDQHIAFAERPMRDLYFTLMNQGFNLGLTEFGHCALGTPLTPITEILAQMPEGGAGAPPSCNTATTVRSLLFQWLGSDMKKFHIASL